MQPLRSNQGHCIYYSPGANPSDLTSIFQFLEKMGFSNLQPMTVPKKPIKPSSNLHSWSVMTNLLNGQPLDLDDIINDEPLEMIESFLGNGLFRIRVSVITALGRKHILIGDSHFDPLFIRLKNQLYTDANNQEISLAHETIAYSKEVDNKLNATPMAPPAKMVQETTPSAIIIPLETEDIHSFGTLHFYNEIYLAMNGLEGDTPLKPLLEQIPDHLCLFRLSRAIRPVLPAIIKDLNSISSELAKKLQIYFQNVVDRKPLQEIQFSPNIPLADWLAVYKVFAYHSARTLFDIPEYILKEIDRFLKDPSDREVAKWVIDNVVTQRRDQIMAMQFCTYARYLPKEKPSVIFMGNAHTEGFLKYVRVLETRLKTLEEQKLKTAEEPKLKASEESKLKASEEPKLKASGQQLNEMLECTRALTVSKLIGTHPNQAAADPILSKSRFSEFSGWDGVLPVATLFPKIEPSLFPEFEPYPADLLLLPLARRLRQLGKKTLANVPQASSSSVSGTVSKQKKTPN